MFLSVDIGGTKTLLALFSHHGLCLKRLRFPTTGNPEIFLSDFQENLEKLIDSSRVRKKIFAITVAIPGKIVITENSYTFLCPNIPWSDIDLFGTLKNLFPNAKFFFANDANLATLYETSRLSPADRLKKTIYLTFSTGIGGGISENGRLSPASTNFEPGHKTYPTQASEWEKLASARAISQKYGKKLTDLTLTPEITSDLVSLLTPGLSSIISAESPATIIIGGPLAYLYKPLKPALSAALNFPHLLPAKRPEESVIYGAYLFGKENYCK